MQERNYQIKQIEQVVEAVTLQRKIVLQLPTGGGKTVEFALLVKRYISNTDKSVLILVHREELMNQAAKTIEEIVGVKPWLITSKTKRYYISRVYIGMVDSTVSRLNMFANVGLVIIDECHIANFNKMHSVFLDELIIGVTATPISASLKVPLNKFYSNIVCGPSIKELISMKYLAQNITRCPKDIVDTHNFEIDRLKGDYNETQMATEYKMPKHITNVIKQYFKFCKGEKTIVFNVNIEHSKEVAECFQACGYNARHLGSDNNHERKEILQWFKETKDAILCNVMIATVGFDEPTVKNIILNFATLSLPKFIQCCGRGSRFIDEEWINKYQKDYLYEIETKNYFNIIDMGGNYTRFGDWCDDRDWAYIFNHPDISNDGIAPVKTCPECEGLVHAAVRVCTCKNKDGELCLYEFVRKPTAQEQDIEEMILVTKGINIDELTYKSKRKYQYYPMMHMADDVVKEMFKKYGRDYTENIKDRYFKTYYGLCVEWYDKYMANNDGNMEDIRDSGFHIRMALNNFNSLIKKYNEQYQLTLTNYAPQSIYQAAKLEQAG